MERRVSTAIQLSEELVDQNGQARFVHSSWDGPAQQDLSIAPFLDMERPPTPPPKPYHIVPQTQVYPLSSSHRGFGFPSKGSFSSLVTMRQNSTPSLVRINGGSSIRSSDSATLVPESIRPSTDDTESSRATSYSGSSTHSGEIRKSKSSYNLFSKFTSRPPKVSLRPESDESDHPSLRSPEPHLSQQRTILLNGRTFANGSTPTIVSIPSSTMSKSRQKIKKKSGSKLPPSPPPKDIHTTQGNLVPGGETSIIEVSPEDLEGIVDFNIASANHKPGFSNPLQDPSSPSSGFESTQSQSDHSSYHHHHSIPAPEFINPFNGELSKNQCTIPQITYDLRKVSPKSIEPPPPETSTTKKDPEKDPSWDAPPSWHVVKPVGDRYNPEQPEAYNSDSDREINGLPDNGSTKVRNEDRMRRRARNAASASFSSTLSTTTRSSRGTLGRLPNQPPAGVTYKMRLYTPNSSYHVIAIDLDTTVANLMPKLLKKITSPDAKKRLELDLCVRENGRERVLGLHEKPAGIVKLRMDQAGYDYEDGLHLLGTENLNILLRFVLKEPHLGSEVEHIDFDNYEVVDLSGAGFRAIPPVLHRHSDQIICLRLSRNPMIKIPLDFIQSCTSLGDLRLTHMSLKKVPESILESLSLHRLDISSNAIRDLSDAILDKIPGLNNIQASNNRLDKLPWHFGRLKALTILNISNNRFREFPSVVTQILTLHELDISFNMISELPEDIGLLKDLQRLTLIGNQLCKFPTSIVELVRLEILDIRRNQISDLSLVYNLPRLTNLNLDHNAVHALDHSLSPHLKYLVASHNDITRFSLPPCPENKPSYNLSVLDLSYAKLYSIDEETLSQLSSLRVLKLDHNSIRSIPDSLGDLLGLEAFSCTDNKLDSLPSSIGRLQYLHTLDTHNNNLNSLPESLWECGGLKNINLTSNFISSWPHPPVYAVQETCIVDGNLAAPAAPPPRKSSVASLSSTRPLPPLVHRLEKLYIGENCLTDNSVLPLMIFKELKVLNLSFNEIQDLPGNFFRNMLHLEELYLSGNKLTSIPSEDLPKLHRLSMIFLNGNRLVTLPQELGEVKNLTVLDAGSNFLKYNINNLDFDWNWNFNKCLRYLNLSGNKRLQIKAETMASHQRYKLDPEIDPAMLSGFTSLQQLKVLGLMDVTIIHTAQDATVDIPDENMDCRVRTSLSTVCGMGYGIADSLGHNDSLTMLDLVHEFRGRPNEALFAMIGRTHPPKFLKLESSPNRLSKYLHDNFVNVFKAQLACVNEKQEKEGIPLHLRKEGIPRALTWTFLKLNQDLHGVLQPTRKNSQASLNLSLMADPMYNLVGVSGIAVYFLDKTLYAANVGDALAVVSRQGICHEISRKHDPFDRLETIRIRSAEGWISPAGLVNEAVDVSRSFGYYHLFPPINARPDVFVYDLSDMDEFVIIANRGLWDFVPYQTAVDIARSTVSRTEYPDPMLAAQKLRDFAISYGADGSTMVMVLWVADLFNRSRPHQPTLDPSISVSKKKDDGRDIGTKFLQKEIPAPTGHITIVFTDIRNSTHLWEVNRGMPTAMRLHNTLLRRQLRLCGGYEVKTEGDSFMCSFSDTLAAVWWCLAVQVQLLHEPWPSEILECKDGKTIHDSEGRLVARGLSVRMGIHCGSPLCEPDLVTHRMDYFGPMVNRSARIQSSALGGQIACSNDIVNEIRTKVFGNDHETNSEITSSAIGGIRDIGVEIVHVGETKLKGIELPEILSILYPTGLEGRHNLKEAPPDPSTPASTPAPAPRVVFSSDNIQKLGMLCLRTEALSTNRRFREISERKGSVQLDTEPLEESIDNSRTLYGNPSLLLPPINNDLSESELMIVLDSLSLRISNAVNTIAEQHNIPPVPQVEPASVSNIKKSLLDALTEDAVLDEKTMRYISAVLECS